MRKEKLLRSCIALGMLTTYLSLGETVRANESIQNVPVSVSEAENTTAETEEPVQMENETPEAEDEQETVDEEPDYDSEKGQEPEEESVQITVSESELYNEGETQLEVGGYEDTNLQDVLHELITLKIPEGLKTGKLTIPVFENAEVSVLVNGEEIEADGPDTETGDGTEEIGIKIKPLGNALTQVQKLILSLVNESSEQSEVEVETLIQRFFKDGYNETTLLKKLSIVLKGNREDTEPVPDTGEDQNPEVPEEQESETEEKKDEAIPDKKQDEKKEEPVSVIPEPIKEQIINISQIIDNSGLNLMEASLIPADGSKRAFQEIKEASKSVPDTEYFEKKKIETASIEDAGDAIRKLSKEAETEQMDNDTDPVTRQEKEIGIQEEKKKQPFVLPIFLAVAAAAGAVFVPLAKKRHSDSEDGESGTH